MRAKRRAAAIFISAFVILAGWQMTMAQARTVSDATGLASAIAEANRNESGAITLSADIVLSQPLPQISSQLTIDGAGHSISGDERLRIFLVDGGQLEISHLTLTRGKAEAGAAIKLQNGARVKASLVTFADNMATNGGAIAMTSADDQLDIDRSSFDNNRAEDYGGAIHAYRGAVAIHSSSFLANHAPIAGGAIYGFNRQTAISNSAFSRNSSGGGGGALDLHHGDFTLTHLTFVNNSSNLGAGHAIFRTSGKVYLRNSIISGSAEGHDCNGGLDQNRGNLSDDGSCGIRASDAPRLGSLSGQPAHHPLLDGSHAIDAADPEFCPAHDQLGTARPQGAGCDIGAIEAIGAIAAAATIVPPLACSLSYQIIAANTDRPAGGCPAGNGADTIIFTRDITLFAALPAITSPITIEGNGHSISGNRQFRIFTVDGGRLAIKDLTLTEGRVHDNGGAIKLQNGGQAIISDSTFSNNSAENGGAIATKYPSIGLSIRGSSFINNYASWDGGAIVKHGGNVTIATSSFVNNMAGGSGGAIQTSSAGMVEVSDSTFLSNWAARGGAIQATGALTTLTHVTMLGNSTGIWVYDDRRPLKLRNSLIANSKRGVDCRGPLTQNINNFIADGSCQPMLSGDPMLAKANDAASAVPPRPGSPLLAAADPRFCSQSDQLGNRRPGIGACDIGAVELPPVISALASCQVTSTHGLNLRDAPSGTQIGSLPANTDLTARARTPGWFQVKRGELSGWISAHYVKTAGDCD